MTNLVFASIASLGLLWGFILILVMMIMAASGAEINLPIAIGVTIAWNVAIWLIGPWISDLIYRFLYKVEWVDIETLRKKSAESAKIIESISSQYNITLPKLGIIPDNNPNAFTYGSGKWNSRIIVTEGIFHFLDEGERSAVYAHELWHIRNNDFIIMTIASTFLQIIYEIYFFSKKMSERKSSDSKKWNPFILIAIVAYLFYVVGNYALLYLSRVREYFADKFSAEHTDPNHLAQALVKIALGILATPENNRLIESTKHIGIASAAMSEWLWLTYANCQKANNFEALAKSFLFDIKSPWAWIAELSSTHPLSGKRIRALMKYTTQPIYDIDAIEQKFPIDRTKLYGWFWRDVFLLIVIRILPIITLWVGIYYGMSSTKISWDDTHMFFAMGWGMLLWLWVSLLISTYMKYGSKEEYPTTILDTMGDIYTSPVRGKRVSLEWTIIGKWIPGFIFSEDLMLQDTTGLMYLDYESKIPIIGNLIFSLSKVKNLIDKSVRTNGWFFRWVWQRVVIDTVTEWEVTIKWGARFWWMIGGYLFLILGIAGFVLATVPQM